MEILRRGNRAPEKNARAHQRNLSRKAENVKKTAERIRARWLKLDMKTDLLPKEEQNFIKKYGAEVGGFGR